MVKCVICRYILGIDILLFVSALIKGTGLRNEGKIDDRSFWVNYVSSVSTPLAIPLVYPRMIPIHDLNSKVMAKCCLFRFSLISYCITDNSLHNNRRRMDPLFQLQFLFQVSMSLTREYIFLKMATML